MTDDSCLRPLSAANLATQLAGVARSFVGYSEDLPEPGFTGCTSGDYAQKHAVWAAFTNLPPGAHQPWSVWPSDYTRLPTVAAVIPNLCNDMHDCDVAVGDRWLRENLADYLTWASTHNSLLLVTFDESDSSHGSNQIVTLLGGAKLRSGRVGEPVDHYRLLRTIEAMYGCPRSDTPPTPPRSPTSGPVAEAAVRRPSVARGCSARSRPRRWRRAG